MTEKGDNTVYHIYTTSSLYQSLQHITETYFTQRNVSLDYYSYDNSDINTPPPLRIDINKYSAGNVIFDSSVDFDNSQSSESFEIDSVNDLSRVWSFNISSIVQSLRSIEIKMSFINYNLDTISQPCYIWDISSRYVATTSGRIDLDFVATPALCTMEIPSITDGKKGFSAWSDPGARDSFIVLLVLILCFCTLSQLLYIKALYRDLQFIRERRSNPVSLLTDTKRGGEGTAQSSASTMVVFFDGTIPCSEAIKFINAWFVIATVSNVLLIVHSSYCLSRGVIASNEGPWLAVMGFGGLAAWLSVTQFFESTSTYYVLIATLQGGIPRVSRFFIGILPIFFAYAMFGVAYFSSYSYRFSTLDNACVTLFSLLNGDVIHDVFDDLHANSPVISRIYLYSFLALFIYAVLNIFVAIIEDSFFATKHLQDKEKESDEARQLLLLEFLEDNKVNEHDDLKEEEGKGDHSTAAGIDGDDHKSDEEAKATYYKQFQLKQSLLSSGESKSDGSESPTPAEIKSSYFSASSFDKGKNADYKSNLGNIQGQQPSRVGEGKGDISLSGFPKRSGSPEFQRILDIVDKALIEDLKNEFSQVSLELKFPADMLRPPHQTEFFPCGFEDCIYCAVRTSLLKNLDLVHTDVKDKVKELVQMMVNAEKAPTNADLNLIHTDVRSE